MGERGGLETHCAMMRLALEKEVPRKVKLVVSVQSGPTARLSFVQLNPSWVKPLAALCRVCPDSPNYHTFAGCCPLRAPWLSWKGGGRALAVEVGEGERGETCR